MSLKRYVVLFYGDDVLSGESSEATASRAGRNEHAAVLIDRVTPGPRELAPIYRGHGLQYDTFGAHQRDLLREKRQPTLNRLRGTKESMKNSDDGHTASRWPSQEREGNEVADARLPIEWPSPYDLPPS